MKTKIIILLAVCVLPLLAQDMTQEMKLDLTHKIPRTPVATLVAIDPDCPTNRLLATIYFTSKICAFTNSSQYVALSNSLASHQ